MKNLKDLMEMVVSPVLEVVGDYSKEYAKEHTNTCLFVVFDEVELPEELKVLREN